MIPTLFYINGYSQNEVADFLEVPVSTAKKRLHDSRRKLKESMMNMVEQTLKDSAPTEEFEKKLLQRMQAFGPWGKWVDEGKERVAIFKDGPWTSLASPQTWPGDAVVAEFDARGELESEWGMGWESYFSPCKDMTEAKAMDHITPVYANRFALLSLPGKCQSTPRRYAATSHRRTCRRNSRGVAASPSPGHRGTDWFRQIHKGSRVHPGQ